jgi:hypothetical protein
VGLRTMLSELKDVLTGREVRESAEKLCDALAAMTAAQVNVNTALARLAALLENDDVAVARSWASAARENKAEVLMMLSTLNDPARPTR